MKNLMDAAVLGSTLGANAFTAGAFGVAKDAHRPAATRRI